MQNQFDIETRAGISHEIARWMGLDGQDAHRSDLAKVVCIDLRHIDDESNRETQIAEFRDNEISGSNGLDAIVDMIASATLRDAMTRYGNALYAIYFHLAGGQMNRGRYPFFVPGAAHMFRGNSGGNGSALALRHGRGDGSSIMNSPDAADALKVSVEFLKWSTEERKANDERSMVLFKTMQEVIKSQAAIIDDGLRRELRVRELEADMLDHKYELDKKRKSDEEREKWVGKAIEAAETYGPMILPPVVELIRRFNGGPNYVPQEMNLDSIQEKIRQAKEAAGHAEAAEAAEANGNGHAPHAHTNGTNGNGNGGPPPPAAAPPDGEPSPIEIFHHRIAFDLVRFVALTKASNHLDQMRAALEASPSAQQLLDAIVVAATKPEVGKTEESINELSQLALTFGSTLMAAPAAGLQLAQCLEGFERAALLELSDLLKRYVEFVQQVQASQQPPPPGGQPRQAEAR
jgi:hypothetical protein